VKLGADGRTLVMGIVNVTPDSFSDGGRYFDPERAVHHALKLIEQGADVLDIGAESTRPSASTVDEAEEWRRLEPVLEGICSQVSVPVSVDTYKASVAKRALDAGATIINDIWGGLADPEMLKVAAESDCTYIWMHNRRQPAEQDAVDVLLDEATAAIFRCEEAGIKRDRLWIDPGIGFGKTYQQNLQVLQALPRFCSLGAPVLLATSRKSVIGNTLNLPPEERLEGSLATVVLGIQAGVRAVRVHDVEATVRACRMAEAILNV
jgi:dihydropteroate synthase